MNRDSFGFRDSEPIPKPTPQVSRRYDLRRIYSAVVFVPLFYLLVRFGPPILFFSLVTIVSLLALWEFHEMFFPHQRHRMPMIAGAGLLLGLLVGMQWFEITSVVAVLTIGVLGSILFLLVNDTPTKQMFPPGLILPFGVLFVGIGLGHFLFIRNLPEGDLFVFFVLLVTWTADTAAYFTGVKTMGRRPLWLPRLSPKKTVEGFLGGLLVCYVWSQASAISGSSLFSPSLECVMMGVALLACLGLYWGTSPNRIFKRSLGGEGFGIINTRATEGVLRPSR